MAWDCRAGGAATGIRYVVHWNSGPKVSKRWQWAPTRSAVKVEA